MRCDYWRCVGKSLGYVTLRGWFTSGGDLLSYLVRPEWLYRFMELSLRIRARNSILGGTLSFALYSSNKHTVISRKASWCANVVLSPQVLLTVGSSIKNSLDRVLSDVFWTFRGSIHADPKSQAFWMGWLLDRYCSGDFLSIGYRSLQ